MTATPSPGDRRATVSGLRFYWVSILTALSVGALQMYRVRGGLLTDYGADLFGTAWLYAMTRLGRTVIQRGRTMGAVPAGILIFALCTLSEFGQRLGIVPGRFDPYDILTYAVAILLCWIVERAAPMVTT
jgi:hypothetical protein